MSSVAEGSLKSQGKTECQGWSSGKLMDRISTILTPNNSRCILAFERTQKLFNRDGTQQVLPTKTEAAFFGWPLQVSIAIRENQRAGRILYCS